jgi:hypothetical protein
LTALDDKLVPKAKELLTKFGRTVTYRTNSATFDPVESELTGGAITNTSVLIVPPFPYDRRLIDGDKVMEGDMLTYIAAQDAPVTPTLEGTIVDGTEVWRIISVDKLYTGDSLALWKLQLRGGV